MYRDYVCSVNGMVDNSALQDSTEQFEKAVPTVLTSLQSADHDSMLGNFVLLGIVTHFTSQHMSKDGKTLTAALRFLQHQHLP